MKRSLSDPLLLRVLYIPVGADGNCRLSNRVFIPAGTLVEDQVNPHNGLDMVVIFAGPNEGATFPKMDEMLAAERGRRFIRDIKSKKK